MLDHWNCEKCKSYNDILNTVCWDCKSKLPDWLTLEYQAVIEIRRDIYLSRGFDMTEQEELFAKFYNQEKILVKDMDFAQLREHRDELAKIAFEAKARLVATDEETRERSSKTKNKDWLTTVDTTTNTADAINAVKVRSARMTKMDKMKQQLLNAGLDDALVNEMIRKMERTATEKDVKAITFNKPTVEQSIVVVQTKKDENGDKTPFDPSALFGKSNEN